MTTDARQKFVVGNWKMHTTASEAKALAKGVIDGFVNDDRVTVILCPPFPYLSLVGEILRVVR